MSVLGNENQTVALVFSGGAFGGFLHLGALRAMEIFQQISSISEICGVSVGSLIGLCVSLKMKADDIISASQSIYSLTGVSDNVMDVISLAGNLARKGGFTSPVNIYNVIKDRVLNPKGIRSDVTFLELYRITNIKFIVVCTERQSEVVYDHQRSPNTRCLEAIIASMSIPLLYEPQQVDGRYLVDGCLANPCPIDLVASDKIIYFRIISSGLLATPIKAATTLPAFNSSRLFDVVQSIAGMNTIFEEFKYKTHKVALGDRLVTLTLPYDRKVGVLDAVQQQDRTIMITQGIFATYKQLFGESDTSH